MLKIGLVVASSGGPERMPALFEKGFSEDAVWMILQRHADAKSLESLAEALAEITGRRVRVAAESQVLHGGDILVLLGDRSYGFSENRLNVQDKMGELHLDGLLLALCDAKAALACVWMTGPGLEGQGLTGLNALAKCGAKIYGVKNLNEPAGAAVKRLAEGDLPCEALDLGGALARVQFGRKGVDSRSN